MVRVSGKRFISFFDRIPILLFMTLIETFILNKFVIVRIRQYVMDYLCGGSFMLVRKLGIYFYW